MLVKAIFIKYTHEAIFSARQLFAKYYRNKLSTIIGVNQSLQIVIPVAEIIT